MIQCPAGFREWRAGDALMYSPREGRVHCIMTYEERVMPLRSLAELMREVVADDAEFQPSETLNIVRYVTHEGEYAARMVVKGQHHGRPIAHIVSAVFAEDFSTRLAARVEMDHLEPNMRLVDDMTRRDRLALGVRRRRFGFTPPKDWHPIPGLGLDMVLLPPDYPKTHASITVYPAEPLATATDPRRLQNEHDARVGLPSGDETGKLAMTRREKKGLPLVGEEWTSKRILPNGQGKMVRYLVVLRDSRYIYSTKLEALEVDGLEALHGVFLNLMGSIEAIPLSWDDSFSAPSFEMWNE